MHKGRSWIAGIGKLGLVARIAFFCCAMLAATLVLAPLAFFSQGISGVTAVAAALGICLVAGLLALVLTDWMRDPALALPQMLLGMALRSAIPLGACLLVYYQKGPLADAGMVYHVLAYYFVMLVTETVMSVGSINAAADGTTTTGSPKAL